MTEAAHPLERPAADQPGLSSLAERKAWALRRGDPRWLWPECSSGQWARAMMQIERACVSVLRGERPAVLDGDPVATGLAGYTSGMGPLLGLWCEQGVLPASAPLAAVLSHQLHANRLRMERLVGHAAQLASALASRRIDMTLLKGIHTAGVFFPEIGCRPMSDIDVLIRPHDLAAATGVLTHLGYRQTARNSLESTWRQNDCPHEPHTLISLEANDPWSIDLHLSLDVCGPPGAAPARLSMAAGTAVPSLLLAGSNELSQPLLLLHLAAHAGSGFHNLTLLRLVEIVLIARTDVAGGTLSWDDFVEVGAVTGALSFAFPALALARQLSPADIPEAVVERCALAAPPRVRRAVAELRPATAHRICSPTLREHFAWTRGSRGWLRRLAADLLPQPHSVRGSAVIHLARVRGLLSKGSTQRQP